jgi:CHAD domain-containing protein
MRRTSLCIELLPKKIRKAKTTRTFLTSLDEASKANAKVRDLDIILSKISTYKPDPSIEERISGIKEKRESHLQAARRQTIALQKERMPRITEKDLSFPKLQKRLNKTTNQLIAAINARLPMILKDSNNVRDLHLLRIDCRRLRYLAELFRSKKTARLLSRLRSWQSQLGFIHDSDLTIDYLRDLGEAPEMQPFLNDLVTQRMRSYEKFSSIAKQISPVSLLP